MLSGMIILKWGVSNILFVHVVISDMEMLWCHCSVTVHIGAEFRGQPCSYCVGLLCNNKNILEKYFERLPCSLAAQPSDRSQLIGHANILSVRKFIYLCAR